MSVYPEKVKELLELALKEQASDIHFSNEHEPVLRIDRELIHLKRFDKLNKKDLENIAFYFLTDAQKKQLEQERTVEFSYEMAKDARFRTSVFYQRGAISIAMRLIPAKIRTIEELNLPSVLHNFSRVPQGFALITGPSSQGKSTTLAALVQEVNENRSVHIITVEDPIEYFFEDKEAIVDQREVGRDTISFGKALERSFRQDPDVIMVGEMRDRETIATAITAAETGHLVFSTLHTNSAAQAIHRIVDSFPPQQQTQIRNQLSTSLLGIVSQRLLPRVRGGLIPACEVLIANPAVGNLIRENKIHEIPMVIETSADQGMITLNKALANLVRAKEISLKTAVQHSLNPGELRELVGSF